MEFSEVERPVRIVDSRNAGRKILRKKRQSCQFGQRYPEHLDLMSVRPLTIAWRIIVGYFTSEEKVDYVSAGGRQGIPQLDEVSHVDEIADIHGGPYLFDTFSVERISQRLTRVLCAAGQGETLRAPATLFSEQQDLVLSNDQGACCISNFGCQFWHAPDLQMCCKRCV